MESLRSWVGLRHRITSALLFPLFAALWGVCAFPQSGEKTLHANDKPEYRVSEFQVLDILRVSSGGDAAEAVVPIPPSREHKYSCDLVIIGGGMGGVSAAHEAARDGLKVCMTEPTLWIGGQMTSEGVSAFDDNQWIETSGATASYLELAHRIRTMYLAKIPSKNNIPDSATLELNPGNCWVSRLCFEPGRGLEALQSMLKPFIDSGKLQIWLHTAPVQVARQGRTIGSVLAYDFVHQTRLRLTGKFYIDASEWGDVVRLSGLPFRIGAEARSETGERDAPDQAYPKAIQSFTYPFLLLDARKSALVRNDSQPPDYKELKKAFTLTVDYGKGKFLTYGMFDNRPGTPGSFWTYRRVVDAAQYRPGAFSGDLSMINWSSNDYCDARLMSDDPFEQAAALQKGKRLSLGFAWWLRHEAERDDHTGLGYPTLQLQLAGMGSQDGLSQQPYIRESRRIISLRTIVEEDVSVDFQKGPRAALYPDSVGIGQYPLDSHSCGLSSFGSDTKPYEVPLGALIPKDADNLLAASKNIGTTHISNGAYRLHPTEWSIGEAAGAAVAWSVQHGTTPTEIDMNPVAIAGLQNQLLRHGHPIFWFDDVSADSRFFIAAQLLSVREWLPADSSTLHFAPDSLLTGGTILAAMRKAGLSDLLTPDSLATIQGTSVPTWETLRTAGLRIPETTRTLGNVTRGEFANWLLSQVRPH